MAIEVATPASTWRAERCADTPAVRIANEVRSASRLGESKLTKVTSLLHAFRASNTPAKMREVARALESEGLRLSSGWPSTYRPGVLKLTYEGAPLAPTNRVDIDESIQISVWRPDSPGYERPLPLHLEHTTGAVAWFNIDPAVLSSLRPQTELTDRNGPFWRWHGKEKYAGITEQDARPNKLASAAIDARSLHVLERLEHHCPGLDDEMVRDLLRRDAQPKVETYGDEKDGVRGVSVVAAITRELPQSRHIESDGVSEQLIFQVVEILVGPGWIVTCWHSSDTYAGTNDSEPGPSMLREPCLSHVRQRWLNDPHSHPKSSGDLGIYLARSLVDTYGASHRMMERWVKSWEGDFYRSLCGGRQASKLAEAAGEISNSLSMIGELRRRLTSFDHARWSTTDKCWFPEISDRAMDSVKNEEVSVQVNDLSLSIHSAQQKLALLSVDVRADMDLLMLQSAATQQESTERLQSRLALVTGLVLVPTLVVGFFGANTRLPGGHQWSGFDLMLLLMLCSAVLVYVPLRRLAGHGSTRTQPHKPPGDRHDGSSADVR